MTSLELPGGPLHFNNYGQGIQNGEQRSWNQSGVSVQDSAIRWAGSGQVRVNGYDLGSAAQLEVQIPTVSSGSPSVLAGSLVGLRDTFSVLPNTPITDGFVRFEFLVTGTTSYSASDVAASRNLFVASLDWRAPAGSVALMGGGAPCFPLEFNNNGIPYKQCLIATNPVTNLVQSQVSLLVPYAPSLDLNYVLRTGAITPVGLRGGDYSIGVNLLSTATLVGADLFHGTIAAPGERIAGAAIVGSGGEVLPTAVPEPSTVIAGLSLGLVLMMARRGPCVPGNL